MHPTAAQPAVTDGAGHPEHHAPRAAAKPHDLNVKTVRSLIGRHPYATAAIGGGVALVGLVGLVLWLRD